MADTRSMMSFAQSGAGSSLAGSSAMGAARTSSAERLFRAAKNGMFGILFVMVKDATLSQFWVVIELLIDLAQVLGFPFNVYHQHFAWNQGQSSWFQDIVRPFSFETYIDSSIAVFFVAVGILLVLLANAAFVGYSFSSSKYKMMWTLTSLRFISALVSSIFFIPLLGILTARLRCEEGSECWTGFDLFTKILALVVGIAFLFLSLMCCICFSDPNPASRSVLSRPHSRIDLFTSAVRATLTIVFTLLTGSNTNQWVLTGILLAAGVSTASLYTWYLPCYRFRYSVAKASTFWILTWAAICLLVVQVQGTQENQAFVFFLIGSPLVVYATHSAAAWRRKRIETTPCNKLRSALDIELKVRLHLIAAGVFFTYRPASSQTDACVDMDADNADMVDEAVARHAIAEANSWYRAASRRNPRSSLLHLFWSNHHQYFMGNSQLALAELQAAEELSPRLDEEFFIYRRRKMAQDEIAGGKGDVIQFIKYQKNMTDAQRHDIRATKAQLALWSELIKTQPDPMSLNSIARRVTSSITRAQTGYQELIRINPNAPQTLRMYAGFLIDVVHDTTAAETLIARAAEIDDSTGADGSDKGTARGNALDMGTMGVAEMLMDDRHATITMSGDLHKEGSVVEMNTAACRLLGYRPRELIGRNIAAIVPDPFSSKHNSYIRRYLEEGSSRWMDRAVHVYALHKSGYCVPIVMLVKQMCSPTGGILFIAAMKAKIGSSHTGNSGDNDTIEERTLLVGRDGAIVTCTAGCGSLLGIGSEQFASGAPRMPASKFIPDYASLSTSAAAAATATAAADTASETPQLNSNDFADNCKFDGVCIVTSRGTAFGTVSIRTIRSSSGEVSIVIKIDMATERRISESLGSPLRSSPRPRALSVSSSQCRRSDDNGMPALLPLETYAELNTPRSIPDIVYPKTIDAEDTPVLNAPTAAPNSERRIFKTQSKVQFNAVDSVSDERRSSSDQEVAIEMEDVGGSQHAGQTEAEANAAVGSYAEADEYDDEVPEKARSVTSGSHASSTASRLDNIREQILYGSGAGTGRIGTVLRVSFLLAAVGIIAIAAVSLVKVRDETKSYATAVDDVISASKRRLQTYDMIDATRLLFLKGSNLYDQYTETGLRNRLNRSGNDLNTIHQQLFAGFGSLPEEHKRLYTLPTIPIAMTEGGEPTTRMYNLWNLLDTLVMEARMLAQLPLADFVAQPPSVYFITKNILTSVWNALEQSMNLYEAQATTANNNARETAKVLFIIALAFVLISTVFVLLPLLALVEWKQTDILWTFLSVPRPVGRALAERCLNRLQARESLDDGFDESMGDGFDDNYRDLKDTAEKDEDEDAGRMDADTSAKSPLGLAFGRTAGLQGVRLSRRGGKHRSARRPPTVGQRIRLLGINQAGSLVRIAALLIASIVFFCIMYALVTRFIDDNSGTAISVNNSNRRTYQTLVSFHLLREIVYANTTEDVDRLDSLFSDASTKALQLHTNMLYGNATLGILPSATEPRFQTILFENGCIDTSPVDCSTFNRGLLTSGLSVSLQRFLRDVTELRALAVILPIPRTPDMVKPFYSQPNFVMEERFGQRYLRPSLIRMTELFGTTLTQDVNVLNADHLIGTVVFCCVVGAIYVALLMPIPGRASAEAKRMQVLLLCVPPEMLRTTLAFSKIIKANYASSR